MKNKHFLSALVLGIVVVVVGTALLYSDLLPIPKSFAAPVPVISSITPSAGPIGTTVTITGKGFSKSGNAILFGRSGIDNVSSSNGGKVITFVVPSRLPSGRGEILIDPGEYDVAVNNANGDLTNVVTFTVTP